MVVVPFNFSMRANLEMDAKKEAKQKQIKKKWRESEVLAIIEYLHEESEFEHPTAQLFYKKFLKKTPLDASWELVRWKVRHLKAQYKKANDWLASTGAGVLEDDGSGSIDVNIVKICPYYHRLQHIFAKRTGGLAPILCSDLSPMSPPPPSLPSPATPSPVEVCEEQTEPAVLSDAAPSTSALPTAATPIRAPRTAIGTLAKVQQERIAFEKTKLELNERKLERTIEIEERKLIIEEKRLELEIKKQEQEVELRKLEIEMKERVAKYEIDKKYANK